MTYEHHRWVAARVWLALSFALCTVALPLSSPGAETQREQDTTNAEPVRDSMRSLLADIRKLVDASLTERWFVTRADDEAIEAAITNMGNQGAALTAHAPQMDMAFLAAMLEKYAWWLNVTYRQGQYRGFDELLYESLDVCIACHTRLPSDLDSPAAEAFVSSRVVHELPLARQYRLLMATRRFDDAMNLLEAAFAKPFKTWPRASTALRSYILTAVRVKQDHERVIRTLETLAARSDVPADLRRETRAWAGALRREPVTTAAGSGSPQDLTTARERIMRAENSAGTDAESLIDYAVASALLHRYLGIPGLGETALSEAAYMLGLCYHRIDITEALPQAELYLEYSINTKPSSEWAEEAYSLLWMRVVESYSDADSQLPEYVEAHMNELERLISQ